MMLQKFFDAAKHKRGKAGRFAAGRFSQFGQAPAPAWKPRKKALEPTRAQKLRHKADVMLASLPQLDTDPPWQNLPTQAPPVFDPADKPAKRSLVRNTWSIGAAIPELPREYTGDTKRSLPAADFHQYQMRWQIPDSSTPEAHAKLKADLVGMLKSQREPALLAATTKGLIPEGTARKTVSRAYNLAGMLAIHDYGLGVFDHKMDDALKAEMTPLTGAMRYFRRRLIAEMRTNPATKGKWVPYRHQFGESYPTPKYVKYQSRFGPQGTERKRVPPRQEFIKAVPIDGTLTRFYGDPDLQKMFGANLAEAALQYAPRIISRLRSLGSLTSGAAQAARPWAANAARAVGTAGSAFAATRVGQGVKAGAQWAYHEQGAGPVGWAASKAGEVAGGKIAGARGATVGRVGGRIVGAVINTVPDVFALGTGAAAAYHYGKRLVAGTQQPPAQVQVTQSLPPQMAMPGQKKRPKMPPQPTYGVRKSAPVSMRKRAHPVVLAMLPKSHRHITDEDEPGPVMPDHVAAVMPEVMHVLSRGRVEQAAGTRMQNRTTVESGAPLHHVLVQNHGHVTINTGDPGEAPTPRPRHM